MGELQFAVPQSFRGSGPKIDPAQTLAGMQVISLESGSRTEWTEFGRSLLVLSSECQGHSFAVLFTAVQIHEDSVSFV